MLYTIDNPATGMREVRETTEKGDSLMLQARGEWLADNMPSWENAGRHSRFPKAVADSGAWSPGQVMILEEVDFLSGFNPSEANDIVGYSR